MNNTFSFRRFALLVRKHYVETGRQHLYIAGGMFVLFVLVSRSEIMDFYFFASVIFFVGGALWLHRTCRAYYRPDEAQEAYTLPAAQGEKYLFCWLNSYLVYCILFFLMLRIGTFLHGIGVEEKPWVTYSGPVWFEFFLFAAVLHALALFCCSWVKRNPIRGYLLVGGIAVVAMLAYTYLLTELTGIILSPLPGSKTMVLHREGSSTLLYPIAAFRCGEVVNYIAASAAALLFWTAGYFKFRERTLK